MTHDRFSGRTVVLAISLALALAFVACGDSDTEDGRSGSDRAVNDEQVVKDLYKKLEAAMYAADSEAYCAGLTRRMASEIARNTKRESCEAGIRSIVSEPLTPVQIAQVESQVLSVRMDGDGERALLATRGPDGGIDHRTFVKDGPEWRFDRTRWEAVPAPDPTSRAK